MPLMSLRRPRARTSRTLLGICCLLLLIALVCIIGFQPLFAHDAPGAAPTSAFAVATSPSTGAKSGQMPADRVATVPLSPAMPKGNTGSVPADWAINAAWFQRLIFLYASANAPIARAAAQAERTIGLTDVQALQITRAVRQAWVALMSADPASIGRPEVKPNPSAQRAVFAGLRTTLRHLIGDQYTAFLATTDTTYALTSSASWLQSAGLSNGGGSAASGASRAQIYTTVYATSFSISGDTSAYVALPDAYLKYANLGQFSNIPALYQPYYLQGGTLPTPYTVDIVSLADALNAPRVLIKDVGPWNEDDNWWDPTNNSTALPASCPISSTLVSAHSLENAAVDGICPGLNNWRRVYYYLLYQHDALPFFQPGGYSPTGAYADASAWPPALPRSCPEASAASTNNDSVSCASSFPNYNAHAGAWLRSGTYDNPVVNQAGIDLSPGVDAALGWTWPSSGFVGVNLSRLP